MTETISNTTLVKCECGKWVNYAGDSHHIARIRQIADLQRLCGRAHSVLSENFDAYRGKDGYGPSNLESDLKKAADGKEHRELQTLNDELGRVLRDTLVERDECRNWIKEQPCPKAAGFEGPDTFLDCGECFRCKLIYGKDHD